MHLRKLFWPPLAQSPRPSSGPDSPPPLRFEKLDVVVPPLCLSALGGPLVTAAHPQHSHGYVRSLRLNTLHYMLTAQPALLRAQRLLAFACTQLHTKAWVCSPLCEELMGSIVRHLPCAGVRPFVVVFQPEPEQLARAGTARQARSAPVLMAAQVSSLAYLAYALSLLLTCSTTLCFGPRELELRLSRSMRTYTFAARAHNEHAAPVAGGEQVAPLHARPRWWRRRTTCSGATGNALHVMHAVMKC